MLSILLFSFALFSADSPSHALHLSVLEIDGKQMKVKIFTDNLQDAIRADSPSFTPSDVATFPKANQSAIETYFRKKILLLVNEQEVGFHLEKTSTEGNSYWITLRLETLSKWRSCTLKANYLMELFPDQTNMVKVNSVRPQYFQLTKADPSCHFTF